MKFQKQVLKYQLYSLSHVYQIKTLQSLNQNLDLFEKLYFLLLNSHLLCKYYMVYLLILHLFFHKFHLNYCHKGEFQDILELLNVFLVKSLFVKSSYIKVLLKEYCYIFVFHKKLFFDCFCGFLLSFSVRYYNL